LGWKKQVNAEIKTNDNKCTVGFRENILLVSVYIRKRIEKTPDESST
jgi:hypothetical protein